MRDQLGLERRQAGIPVDVATGINRKIQHDGEPENCGGGSGDFQVFDEGEHQNLLRTLQGSQSRQDRTHQALAVMGATACHP
jgi:hypothetical protein